MDDKRRRENLILSLISLALSAVIITFHLICVYYVWNDHGTTSAGISLVLPWFAEVYWSYYDFNWLYMGFVIIGGVLISFNKLISAGLEAESRISR